MIEKFINQYRKNKIFFYLLIFHILFSGLTFGLMNRPFGVVTVLKIPFDDMIPLVKQMIYIYHMFMPLVFIMGLVLFTYDIESQKVYVVSLIISQLIAYVIYYLFQTDVPRADVSLLGDDLASRMIKFTYSVDNHYSGFPSLHVGNMTTLIFILFRSKLSKKISLPVIALAVMIALSTVLVKQHVFLDMPAGIVHGIYSVFIGERILSLIEEKPSLENKKLIDIR